MPFLSFGLTSLLSSLCIYALKKSETMSVENELSFMHWAEVGKRLTWSLGLEIKSVMAFMLMAFFLCLTTKGKVHVFLNEGWLCL